MKVFVATVAACLKFAITTKLMITVIQLTMKWQDQKIDVWQLI